MKETSKQQYYSLDNILSKEAHYNLIFGERSNGKTYAALKYAIEQYVKDGSQCAIIRRFKDDFTGKRGSEMFRAISENQVIEDITHNKYNGIYYYGSRWYLAKYHEDSKGNVKRNTDPIPFAFGFALTAMEHDKGSSYPNVRTVVFDEFLSRSGYLQDEFVLFTNTLSTIIRQRNDVRIIMLGNTVNKYCPYFAEMGLKHVKQMEPGTIDVYSVGNSGLKIAVEYCGTAKQNGKKSDIYFSFDNPKLDMITKGVWEMDIYPHLPQKYKPKDVLFSYFIEFDGEKLHCEIVEVDGNTFTFIHRKTTEIRKPDEDLIYSTKTDPRPNWKRKITKPTSKIEQKVLSYFMAEKVFYQDNEIGEVVRNYLQWCGRSM